MSEAHHGEALGESEELATSWMSEGAGNTSVVVAAAAAVSMEEDFRSRVSQSWSECSFAIIRLKMSVGESNVEVPGHKHAEPVAGAGVADQCEIALVGAFAVGVE